MLIGETAIGELPGIGDSFSVVSKAYDMDMWLVFTGSEPLEDPPGAIRYSLYRNNYLSIVKTVNNPYDGLLAIGRNNLPKTFTIDTSILNALRSCDFDIILRPSYESTIPSTSVMDALVWSYAEILDMVWRQMDTMSTALKLEYAQGTDLDNAWGLIFDLPRIVNEDDTSYRDRLKTRTTILNSSGTKTNCETIINSVIGSDESNVDTQYPGNVIITFDTINAMRIAREKQSTLDILIPEMLADGISYSMMLPFMDCYFDIVMNGPIWLPYNNYISLLSRDLDTTYDVDLSSIFINTISLNSDIYLYSVINKQLLINAMINTNKNKSVSTNIGLFKTITRPINYYAALKIFGIINILNIDSIISKSDIEKYINIISTFQGTFDRLAYMDFSSTLQNILPINFDITTMLYSCVLDSDLLLERDFPKWIAASIILVGA